MIIRLGFRSAITGKEYAYRKESNDEKALKESCMRLIEITMMLHMIPVYVQVDGIERMTKLGDSYSIEL